MANINIPTYTGTIGSLTVLNSFSAPNSNQQLGQYLQLYDNSESQVIPSGGGTFTPVKFNTVQSNTIPASLLTLTANNSTLTWIGAPRYITVTWSFGTAASTNVTLMLGCLLINGVNHRYAQSTIGNSSATTSLQINGTAIIYMNTDDYLQLFASQMSTGSASTTISVTNNPSSLQISC